MRAGGRSTIPIRAKTLHTSITDIHAMVDGTRELRAR